MGGHSSSGKSCAAEGRHAVTGGMEVCMKELTVDATVESIPVITEFVDEQLEQLGCPMKAQAQIDIAIGKAI